MTRFNNILLFFLAATIPFYKTFSSGALKFLNFQYLFIFLAVYFIVFATATKKKIVFGKSGKILTAFILLFLVQVVSGLFSFDVDLAIENLFFELQFIVILLVINGLIINNDSYEYIFKGLLIGFIVSCFTAMMQYMGVKQFYFFSEENLNANTGLTYANNVKTIVRIWGPFGNSLTFSEYLAVAGLCLYSYYRFIPKSKIIAFLVISLSFGCIVLTVGRTALFAEGFSLLLIEFLYARRTASAKGLYIVIAFSTVALIGYLLLGSGIQDNGNPLITRFSNASQDLKEGRLNLWVKGFDAFSKNIFLGVGPGNLHMALASEGFPMTSKVIEQFNGQHVENYYLTILYTFGIAGFLLCVRAYYYLTKYTYRLFILLKGKVKSLAYGGLMFGPLVVLMISNITNPALIFDQRIRLLFIFIIIVINNSFLFFDEAGFYKKENIFKRNKRSLLNQNA